MNYLSRIWLNLQTFSECFFYDNHRNVELKADIQMKSDFIVFRSKVDLSNVKCAWATAFIFDT